MLRFILLFSIVMSVSRLTYADDLRSAIEISLAGMEAQSKRLRIVAENISNKDVIAPVVGGSPYRRQMVIMRPDLDRKTGVTKVKVSKYIKDYKTPIEPRYQPNHPLADENGYVYYPNVNQIIEMEDMSEAQRSYEANINMMNISQNLVSDTISAMKN